MPDVELSAGTIAYEDTGGDGPVVVLLVKPNGLLGTAYMAAIKPFRHLIVYPAMMRQIGRR